MINDDHNHYIYMILYDHSPFKSFDVWEICDIFMVTKNTFGKKCVVTSCRDVTGMMMLRFGESVPNGPTILIIFIPGF